MSYEAALNEEANEAPAMDKPAKRSRTKPVPSFPQFNADGTPVLGEDGNQVWGPEKSEFTSKKPKRERKPKVVEYQLDEEGNQVLDEEGNPIPVVKTKRERRPKYLLNEDGTPQLDEEGNPIPVPKAVRAPRLDADGNPIPRQSNVFLDSQVIHRTEKGKTAKYREGSDRQNMFDAMQDGVTVGEFYAARGGKAASHRFLVHQLNVLETITID